MRFSLPPGVHHRHHCITGGIGSPQRHTCAMPQGSTPSSTSCVLQSIFIWEKMLMYTGTTAASLGSANGRQENGVMAPTLLGDPSRWLTKLCAQPSTSVPPRMPCTRGRGGGRGQWGCGQDLTCWLPRIGWAGRPPWKLRRGWWRAERGWWGVSCAVSALGWQAGPCHWVVGALGAIRKEKGREQPSAQRVANGHGRGIIAKWVHRMAGRAGLPEGRGQTVAHMLLQREVSRRRVFANHECNCMEPCICALL